VTPETELAGPRRRSRSLGWRRRGLLLHRDFLVLWAGESISFIGGQVTDLAVPLTAVLVLGATEQQMGVFGALETLPFLFFGLLAGVWVDRFRRRPLLIAVNLADALLIGSVPVAAALGVLSMAQLYVVAFGAGLTGLLATAGYQAFIPTLVGRKRLVDANSKFEISASVATVVGPSLGGLLVQLLSAPVAVAIDAVSFVVAAFGLVAIRKPEPPPVPRHERGPILAEIREGLMTILGDRRLRLIMTCGAVHNFFANGMIAALYVLYAVRAIGLNPAELGLVLAAGGPGVLLGAVLASRVPRWVGLGPAIAHMQTLTGISRLMVAAAAGLSHVPAFAVLVAAEFLLGLARPIFNVNQLSLRQSLTPDRLLGRMNASIRFLMWSSAPLGALSGGLIGGAMGLPTAMAIGGFGTLAAAVWVYLPPVWRIRAQPTPVR
jgi:predicted MFS family arabinose efflux permease